MILHTKRKESPPRAGAGEVVTKRVRLVAIARVEVVGPDGQHTFRNCDAGEVVDCPIWEAKWLIAERLAVTSVTATAPDSAAGAGHLAVRPQGPAEGASARPPTPNAETPNENA